MELQFSRWRRDGWVFIGLFLLVLVVLERGFWRDGGGMMGWRVSGAAMAAAAAAATAGAYYRFF